MTVAAAPRPRRRRLEPTSLSWRLVRDGAHGGARNMARDHALAACLEPGEGVLRLYAWERPTLSLGRNEPAAAYRVRAVASREIDVVRRPTGGRAVWHDAELTYAVVTPLGALGGVREGYRRINEAIADALRGLGAPVAVAEAGASAGPGAGPCFQLPAAGEVVAGARKLVGSAQVRIGRAVLQHGSILLGGGQERLTELTGGDQDVGGAVTLGDLIGHVRIDEVEAAVAKSLQIGLGGGWQGGGFHPSELAAADRLELERYGLDSWTWRR